MEEVKNIIKVASIYVATIVGAGFASGQEIMQFFSTYYEGGFYGIIFAGFLFSVIGCMVLNKVYTERIKNYDEFLFPMVGWFAGRIMEVVVSLFMVSLFCIMIAGGGNILSSKLEIGFSQGVIIMALICMLIISADIKGVVMASTLVTPVLIAGIIGVGAYIIVFKDTSAFNAAAVLNKLTGNWLFSSLVYVSYNSIMSIVVMCSLLPYLKTRRVGAAGGILGGFVLCLIAIILNTAIFTAYPEAQSQQLPVLNIVEKYSIIVSNFYSIILFLAMVISAATSGYCFIERVSSKTGMNIKLAAAVTCALAVPLSSYGFAGLIAAIYPVFGYIGMFMIFVIIVNGLRSSQ